MPIAITLNGERREVRAASVAELLAEIGLTRARWLSS